MSPSAPTSQQAWHALDTAQLFETLGSDGERGLAPQDAAGRLQDVGPNALMEGSRRTIMAMFFAQFADFMILVLLAAAVLSGFIGEAMDTVAIVVILLLNAVIGAGQEFRAERAVAALRRMAAPQATIVRDGREQTVDATELVPGDLVLLQSGDQVPADLRLLEAVDLLADESAMTGESTAVDKAAQVLDAPELAVAERSNMVFRGTLVTKGRGRGIVVATGMATELGRIAALMTGEERVKTPLQRRLTRFGRYLALAVLAVCAIVFVSGLLQGQPIMLMALTAVSLAVAAIPEALPAVITVSLALGARKLSRQNSLVRNLPAVETLGSVTFICTDKTGTLTENRMTCERVLADGDESATLRDAGAGTPWRELGQALALCNDIAERDGDVAGEATELALFHAAAASGYHKGELEAALPRVAEIPFDSTRKLMTTLHDDGVGVVAYCKGAPEQLLAICRERLTSSGTGPLDARAQAAEAERLAAAGYRVLAVAQRRFDALPDSRVRVESELTLLGLVALIDPPRAEAQAAVSECRSAGITPVMITGDHPGTARAIAERLGIADAEDEVLTGQALAEMPDAVLREKVAALRVYARVSPEQKMRIVKALQARGEFVAMTGDGVNDAPALRRAGIGVAMGEAGTDVAREAADMVLLDDNFATIVGAVREGRRIFDNIRKFIKDTMSSNSGEIWTLFLAPFLGLPIPLLPIHILWINLVTDGLPGLAFTAEPAEPDVMARRPRPPAESIFAHGMWQHIVWVGLFVGGLSIAAQAWAIARGIDHWQTIVFTVLTVSQLFHSVAVRSERASLLSIGLTSNLPMLCAVSAALALQLAVVYLPVLNPIFNTQPLPLVDLAVCLGLSSLVLVGVEVEKALVRRGRLYADALPVPGS